MFILLVLAGVDLLLPAVQIPLIAWCVILLLWVCKGAIREAGNKKPVKEAPTPKPEIFHGLAWIVSPEYSNVYSTREGDWQLVGTPQQDGSLVYVLFSGDEESSLCLTADNLSDAIDQADMVISALSAER